MNQKEKEKKLTQMLIDFLFEHESYRSREYLQWLQKQRIKKTGLCSLFDYYAEKILRELKL